ncbi:MAG: toll/interleukin-1 receptor domain-containing protein, partial [Anaerolineae bacterium]|nr:toll/interleukin-1 receptor domain-containing protein [Anaerolineae bacterium]
MARRTVFLSYQRSSSKIYARYFGDKIDEWKMDLFLDVEDITQGRFDEIIAREIATRDYFIVILTPTTLQSEWVVREIEAALRHRRRIISILMDGFSFDNPLPSAITPLKYYHGIPYIHEYSDSFFDKLKKALTTEVSTQPHQLPTVAGYMTRLRQRQARRFWMGVAVLLSLVFLAVALLGVFLTSWGNETTPEAAFTAEVILTPPPTSTLSTTSEPAALRLVYTDTY